VEAKVLTDVNATSGIRIQAYATSVLTTLRNGVTKLETSGYSAGSLVLTPWTGKAWSWRWRPATPSSSRRLFGVPIVATVSEPESAMCCHAMPSWWTPTLGIGVQWSESSNADDFAKNLIRPRCEGRFGTSVLSPLGDVSCDLTA
jgi:Protein of unknown function (DUF3304)